MGERIAGASQDEAIEPVKGRLLSAFALVVSYVIRLVAACLYIHNTQYPYPEKRTQKAVLSSLFISEEAL